MANGSTKNKIASETKSKDGHSAGIEAVHGIHKCPPNRNETQPGIRHLFSYPNPTFHSSSRETLGFLTCEHRSCSFDNCTL